MLKESNSEGKLRENLTIVFIASLIGILAGLGAYVLKISIKLVHKLFWGNTESFLNVKEHFSFLYIIIVPAIGGLIVGIIMKYLGKEVKGHGMASVIESIFFKGGFIRKRVGALKIITAAFTIGTGGSVGKEDPVIQIGSSIGSFIGQIFHMSEKKLRTLVACGAAAGLAAAFNAPMAGAMFSVEIILGDFGISGFMPIIVASVMGVTTSHFIEGDFSEFILPHYQFNNPVELVNYFILGIFAGILGVLFIKTLYATEKWWQNLKTPEFLKPAIGGLIVGLSGFLVPNIFGQGFDSIGLSLNDKIGLELLLIIILLKIFATSVTIGSGGVGGVFVPSMYIGAMAGLLTGKLSHLFFPNIVVYPGVYAIAGMGAGIAAATHAPITAILLIFELTKDYNIILPLMFATIISSTISSSIFDYSIYTLGLKLKGIILKDGHDVNLLSSINVEAIISKDYIKIYKGTSLTKIMDMVFKKGGQFFHVVDQDGRYIGSFSLNQLKDILLEQETLSSLIVAEDIAYPLKTVSENDNLEKVMDIFGSTEEDELPVIDKDGKIKGIVLRRNLIKVYNNEIKKREVTNRILSKLKFTPETGKIEIDKGYVITELPVPPHFIGKTIAELQLRKKYGIEVLLIKKKPPEENIPFPSANYRFVEDDSFIASGKKSSIENLEKIINI